MDPILLYILEIFYDNCAFINSSDPLYNVGEIKNELKNTQNAPNSKDYLNINSTKKPETYFEGNKQLYAAGTMFFQLGLSGIVILITVISMWRQVRKASSTKCFGLHFTSIIPVNFLEERQDRLTVLSAFGVTAVDLLDTLIYTSDNMENQNPFLKAFVRIIIVLSICVICLPFFICYAAGTYITLIFGIIYALIYLFSRIWSAFSIIMQETQKCTIVDDVVAETILVVFGTIMVIGYCRKIHQKLTQLTPEPDLLTFQKLYLVNLVTSKCRTPALNSRLEKLKQTSTNYWKTHFYYNTKGFRFSLSILVSVTVGAILVTYFIAKLLIPVICLNNAYYTYFEHKRKEAQFQNVTVPNVVQLFAKKILKLEFKSISTITLFDFLYDQYRIIFGSIYASFGVTYILFIFTILHMLKSYKENILSLCKQEQPDFLLQLKNDNVSIVVSAIQYCGYQVAYFLWGVFVQWIVLIIFFITFCEALVFPLKYATTTMLESLADKFFPIIIIIVLTKGMQRILVKFAFLQEDGSVLGLDNRRGFYNMMYFMFFYNIFLGIFSCLMRVIKNVVFGIWFLPRLDRSIFPKTFEHMDTGFRSYACLLQLEMLQSNIIVVSAANILIKCIKLHDLEKNELLIGTIPELEAHKKTKRQSLLARNRWFLVYTLIRNPQLTNERRCQLISNNVKTTKEKGILKQCLKDIIFPVLNIKNCLRC